jgi:CDP-glycerol glycerophosphotransferase (TagB/SpsB family)
MLKPLINYVYKHEIAEIGIYAPFINNYPDFISKNLNFEAPRISQPYLWKPDITFVCDFSYQFVEGMGKIVNIGHGTICKGWFYSYARISQRENCADLICVPGTIHQDRLKRQVFQQIAVTGMPKLDSCWDNSLNYMDLMHKFNLDPDHKTVLLAPTFNDEFSILPYLQNEDLTKIFPDFTNLIVKLHGVTDENIKDIFYSFKETNKNVYISDNYDTAELFFVSDLLISDVSSVIYEFLSLDKPILLFDSPKQREYLNYTDADLEWEFRNVGVRFSDVQMLPKLIFKVFTYPIEIQFHDIAEKFISVRDGSSTEKIINHSLALLNEGLSPYMVILTNVYTDVQRKHLSSRYKIASSKDKLFRTLLSLANNIEHKYILYLDGNYDLSPHLASFMLNQIVNTENAFIVVPLIDDDVQHDQNLKFRVNQIKEPDFVKSSVMLGYMFTGQNIDIDTFRPHCFVIDRHSLLMVNFTDLDNEQQCIHEYLSYLTANNIRVKLAYDCLIKENRRLIEN